MRRRAQTANEEDAIVRGTERNNTVSRWNDFGRRRKALILHHCWLQGRRKAEVCIPQPAQTIRIPRPPLTICVQQPATCTNDDLRATVDEFDPNFYDFLIYFLGSPNSEPEAENSANLVT